jgi:hypothetical protein
MSCTMNAGAKSVEVCLNNSQTVYRFGPAGGAPELELSVPTRSVDYRPWPGVGLSIFETVTFFNATYSYTVATGFQRGPDEGEDDIPPVFGSILIEEDGREAASLRCDKGSVMWSYGGGLFDAKKALGLCWTSGPDARWMTCPNE